MRVDEAVLHIGGSDPGRHLGARYGRASDISRLRPGQTDLIGEISHFFPTGSPGYRAWRLARLGISRMLGDDGNAKGSFLAPLLLTRELSELLSAPTC